MDKLVNLEIHCENLKFVKQISDEIMSGALNIVNKNLKSDSHSLAMAKNKSNSGISLCDDEFEDFADVQWIVLDEWHETSEDNFIKSNIDECMKKSKYSSKQKSHRKVDKGNMSTRRNKEYKPTGNINNNTTEKEFIPDDNRNYASQKVSKDETVGEGHRSTNFYTKTTLEKFPGDKFHCEECGIGFDFYEDVIIHVETYHKLSNVTNFSKMVRLPQNPQMLKMFCCSLPNCPNLFSGSSASVLRCHTLTMHQELSIAKTDSLMFCQLCKGDPFEDEDDLDNHLAAVHEVNIDEMKATNTTPAYYYCIICRKPIGPIKTWESHTSAPLHRYKKSRMSLARENNDIAANETIDEAVVMSKREFSACKQEYELQELAKRRQNIKNYATQKNTIFSRLGPKMVPCMNCPDIVRRDRMELHINTKHPHASFRCNYFPRHRVQPCGKNFVTSKKTLAHLHSHLPGIRMCEAIDRGLVKVPRDLRWMRCRICGRCCNGQGLQAMVDHVREEHPKGASSPARVTDFGCRLCGIVGHGVQGYERLQKHIKQKKMRSIIYNKKL